MNVRWDPRRVQCKVQYPEPALQHCSSAAVTPPHQRLGLMLHGLDWTGLDWIVSCQDFLHFKWNERESVWWFVPF